MIKGDKKIIISSLLAICFSIISLFFYSIGNNIRNKEEAIKLYLLLEASQERKCSFLEELLNEADDREKRKLYNQFILITKLQNELIWEDCNKVKEMLPDEFWEKCKKKGIKVPSPLTTPSE